MVRLRLLGQAELTAARGTIVEAVATQPKLLAILSYLALARQRGAPRRDTLLALFWPELDTNAARHALSQALTRLRGELGEGVVDGRYRDTIGISGDTFWCDAEAFREAARSGDGRAALELYRGPLLDGFFLAGAPDFERWVDDERRDLRRLAMHAALELTSAARAGEQWDQACRWAERAIEIDPFDETAWRHLIACRDAAGDRARAIEAFRRMRERLHEDLGVEPAPETLELISVVRARSYATGNHPVEHAQPPVPHGAQVHSRPGVAARRRYIIAASAAVLLAAVISLGFWSRAPIPRSPTLDPNVVAILPFRVAGPGSLLAAGLQEGMVDMLALKLGVGSGPRAIDPRATIHAWNRLLASAPAALPANWPLDLAAGLGARNVLTGSVVGVQGSVVLNATLQSVPDGRILGRAAVSGPADSIMALVDRLAAQVLGLAAGESADRVESLATTSMPALQAYLAGRAAQRGGRFLEAVRHFEHALDLDSTFALAGMGMLAASGWGVGFARQPALHAAWTHRQRLGASDSLRLLAMVGRRYPEPTPAGEQIEFVEQTLLRTPDDVELWFELGEVVFHNGPRIGISNWRERAQTAFERTLRLDSTFAPAIVHLTELAAEARDTTRLHALSAAFLRHAPAGVGGPVHTWLARAMARALRGDVGRQPDTSIDIAGFDDADLRRVITFAISYGISVDDADTALALLHRRSATAKDRLENSRFALLVALARGRTGDAHGAWLSLLEQDSAGRHAVMRSALYYALYWDGSRESAVQAERALAPLADASLAADSATRRLQLLDQCALGQWRLRRGEVGGAMRALESLRGASAATDGASTVFQSRLCAEVLDALVAASPGRAIDRHRLEQLDAVLTDLPVMIPGLAPQIVRAGNLVSARLWAGIGEHQRALDALQRRGHNTEARAEPVAFLREECQLARHVGQHDLAERACDRYHALRAAPAAPYRGAP